MKTKLVCFDLDGTIIENTEFIWKTLHERLGTEGEKRDKAMEDFFKGRITYEEWAKHDCNLWIKARATKEQIKNALKHLRLIKDAEKTLEYLKKKGIRLAIISGSLDIALEIVLPDFRNIFDDIFINKLIFDNKENLIGINPTRYDFERKANALISITKKRNIRLENTAFIGDHDNDVGIAKTAGLSIAFNCKSEELKRVSDYEIKEKDLSGIISLLK